MRILPLCVAHYLTSVSKNTGEGIILIKSVLLQSCGWKKKADP
jgi:hypothetical protein